MEKTKFVDTDNIPPAPDQVTKDIWEVQFPYMIKNPGVCEGIDIGYRAAIAKYNINTEE